MKASIGIDFGTNSARALVVDCETGEELGVGVANYVSGREGILLDPQDERVARQNPGDYLEALEKSVREALRDAENRAGFHSDAVVGIGVASTGSTILPVDAANRPLGIQAKWADRLEAQAWLWKDHTGHREAVEFTRLARKLRPHFLELCGGAYSSESFWAKIWHCANTAPDVFAAAESWVELCDFIPSVLCGVARPAQIRRGICAAGHKALFDERWGGLPDEEFLAELEPSLAEVRDRLFSQAYDETENAGSLSAEWATRLNLPVGIPVAIGKLDVHAGAVGCGLTEGTMVKVIGTSACDCLVVDGDRPAPVIPGISGVVKGSILPGFYGIEAGQSAVGDLFKWWVEGIGGGDGAGHESLMEESQKQRPGESGLLTLDWNNGNRNVLGNPLLSGLLLGQTLRTTRAEIYRALIEATAFGARTILERLRQFGFGPVTIICAGGIAEKSPLLMQIYADVTGCELKVARSKQAVALGAAIAGRVAAMDEKDEGENASEKRKIKAAHFTEAQARMVREPLISYQPKPENQKIYDQLYVLYRDLHDTFGGVRSADLSTMMESLQTLRSAAREQGRVMTGALDEQIKA